MIPIFGEPLTPSSAAVVAERLNVIFNVSRTSCVQECGESNRSTVRVDRLPDEGLIARCARGDRRAMDALVSLYALQPIASKR
jgi:hypothetical protein